MALNKHYTIRPLLGHNYAWYYVIIGARGIGKTVAVQDYFVRKWKEEKIPFLWLRLSKISTAELLANNAEKFIDKVVRDRYPLDLHVRGMDVYDGDERMARVISLSEAAKMKGVAMYEVKPDEWFHCCVDEVIREPNERVLFDLVYNLTSIIESSCRFKEDKIRIFMTCNALNAGNEICSNFNFIPVKHGIYKLKRKRAVIHFAPDSPDYQEKRKQTAAGILLGDQSNFTNKIEIDYSLLWKKRLIRPHLIIKFAKDPRTWYVLWDSGVIARYNKEQCGVIAMRPRLDHIYSKRQANTVIETFNHRGYKFKDISTQLAFENEIALLKPNG